MESVRAVIPLHTAEKLAERAILLVRQEGVTGLLAYIPEFFVKTLISNVVTRTRSIDITDDRIVDKYDSISNIRYGEQETIKHGEPVTINALPEAFRGYTNREYRVPEPFVTVVEEPSLFAPERDPDQYSGGHFIIREPSGDLLPSTVLGFDGDAVQHGNQKLSTIPVRRHIRRLVELRGAFWTLSEFLTAPSSSDESPRYETVTPLIDFACLSYGHWLLNYLPMLQGIDSYRKLTGRKPTILIHRDSPEWVTESLELLGFSNWERMEEEFATANRVVVPAPRYTNLSLHNTEKSAAAFSQSAFKWMRSRILENLPRKRANRFPNQIYLSRNRAAERSEFRKERSVTNEEDLVAYLEQEGIKPIYPEEYSLREQVEMFAHADEIISPHGSALATLIFSSEAIVVELFGRQIGPYHFQQCESIQIDYGCLQCEPDGMQIKVDTSDLRYLLDKLRG